MGYQEIKFEKNSVFLVTGAAGFIGSNLCEALTDMRFLPLMIFLQAEKKI